MQEDFFGNYGEPEAGSSRYSQACMAQASPDNSGRLQLWVEQTARQRLSPDEVLLGGLLQEAAAHFNWKRADDIWQLFQTQHQVKPNFLTYTAYAKAHLLAGRPM